MSQNDAQRLINIIREVIRQSTKSSALIEHSYGQASSSDYLNVSAYVNGVEDTESEDFRVPAHLHISPGDYGMFAVDHGRGSRWLQEILPTSIYSRLALDPNEGVLYIGEGLVSPESLEVHGDTIWEGEDWDDMSEIWEGEDFESARPVWENF